MTSLPEPPRKSVAPVAAAAAQDDSERTGAQQTGRGPLTTLERRWMVSILSAFAPSRSRGLAPREGEVDYLGTAQQMLRASTPIAAFGLRAALWMVALAPMWLWGRFRTVLDLDTPGRTRLLAQLVAHRSFAVRELTMLLKLGAALALLGTPSVRERSGYDNVQPTEKIESGVRRKLPLAVSETGDPVGIDRNRGVA